MCVYGCTHPSLGARQHENPPPPQQLVSVLRKSRGKGEDNGSVGRLSKQWHGAGNLTRRSALVHHWLPSVQCMKTHGFYEVGLWEQQASTTRQVMVRWFPFWLYLVLLIIACLHEKIPSKMNTLIKRMCSHRCLVGALKIWCYRSLVFWPLLMSRKPCPYWTPPTRFQHSLFYFIKWKKTFHWLKKKKIHSQFCSVCAYWSPHNKTESMHKCYSCPLILFIFYFWSSTV